ncbi:MAG: DNA polymerase domain-containing protein [Candidatus Sumerlaeia bacterium]|nr:DNA polymerase domain-containing protein [Candidatus Sumerlaeia bacterium]
MRSATLFDLHCRPEGVSVWLIAADGRRLRTLDTAWRPSFHAAGRRGPLGRFLAELAARPADATVLGPCAERRDFWTDRPRATVEVRIEQPALWRATLNELYRRHPDVEFFNADLLPEMQYCMDHSLVPCGGCAYEADAEGRLARIAGTEDPWAPEYALPELVVAELRGAGELRYAGTPPRRLARLDWIELSIPGAGTERWEGGSPAEVVRGVNRFLARHDPDVILSEGGDSLLMPLLHLLAERARAEDGEPVPLLLDREPPPFPRQAQLHGRSFFSYGQVLYSAPDYPLHGRWHLDRRNSFMVDKSGFDGLVEVCRVSKTPIQRIGRRSVGTGITAIQLDLAYREGYLIPWKKTKAEAWKSAARLLLTDRGGLVYQPLTGAYEDVVEIDFVSMYPTIMSRFNVSPETVDCACCPKGAVPELGYSLCQRRRGLVSRSLEPIIAKRRALKALRSRARAAGDGAAAARHDSRQSALKWLLVCCFGYLGYRNARFGRIEAHEAVCAFARDRLMRAREICEARGFEALHMIVDCLWLRRAPERGGKPSREEIDALCRELEEETGIAMAVEGFYRWIAFLPSRQEEGRPVPNRFFGAFEDGSLKYRGIEARRHDQPPFVRDLQLRCLERLARARSLEEYRDAAPELMEELAEAERALWRHEVPREELFITRALSKAPSEYRGNNMVALAARQAEAAGYIVHAGERITYLIVDQKNRDPGLRVRCAKLLAPEMCYDPAAYALLVRRAFQTLLAPAGIRIDERPAPPGGAKRRARRATVGAQTDLFAED